MRIAIMIPSLSGGGAERAAQILGNHLGSQGCTVYYFVFGPSSRVDYTVKGEICFIDLSYLREQFYGNDRTTFWTAIKKAGRIIKTYKKSLGIDTSISFMEECNYLNVFSSIGDKIIVSVRTTLSERDEFKGFLFRKENIKKTYGRADQIVAVSDYVKNDLVLNYRIDAEKLITIPNIAIKHHSNTLGREWEYGDKVILSVARISPEKQHDHIIRAFKYVHDQCGDSELIILGSGPLENYMKWYATELGLERYVHFIGFVEDIGYYMRNSRAFVMASKAEGFPNSMVEAMAYGIPVVTTNSPGGCREIVADDLLIDTTIDDVKYEKYGIITPYVKGKARLDIVYPEDKLMAKALLSIVNNKDLYEEYKKKALDRAENFSYNTIIKKWDSIIGR